MTKSSNTLSPDKKGVSKKKNVTEKTKEKSDKDFDLASMRKGLRAPFTLPEKIGDKFYLMVQNTSIDIAMAAWLTLKYTYENIKFYGTDMALSLIQESMDFIIKNLLENYSFEKVKK